MPSFSINQELRSILYTDMPLLSGPSPPMVTKAMTTPRNIERMCGSYLRGTEHYTPEAETGRRQALASVKGTCLKVVQAEGRQE